MGNPIVSSVFHHFDHTPASIPLKKNGNMTYLDNMLQVKQIRDLEHVDENHAIEDVARDTDLDGY